MSENASNLMKGCIRSDQNNYLSLKMQICSTFALMIYQNKSAYFMCDLEILQNLKHSCFFVHIFSAVRNQLIICQNQLSIQLS